MRLKHVLPPPIDSFVTKLIQYDCVIKLGVTYCYIDRTSVWMW